MSLGSLLYYTTTSGVGTYLCLRRGIVFIEIKLFTRLQNLYMKSVKTHSNIVEIFQGREYWNPIAELEYT